jgi:hypothetical protein
MWFQKVVTNNTNTTWTSFEHELQSTLGTPSSDGDGLSFAQGYSDRSFSSDLLPLWTEIIHPKDFLNFYGGAVAPGETVTFNYYITHYFQNTTFYIRQRPNEPVPGLEKPPVIPEPTTIGLFGMGLLGLLYRKKRSQ